ncbi:MULTISPECIES: hypothetical protein [unclassified Microcoleus]|uniref:hypothetical protein n=1 Tax=unclassified Microcoleus TaxID=2642155 RepID=UPI002FD4B4AE
MSTSAQAGMRGRLSYSKQSEPETGLPGEAEFHLDRKTSLSGPNALIVDRVTRTGSIVQSNLVL